MENKEEKINRKKLLIYWTEEQGIHYLNDGALTSFEEVRRKTFSRQYSEISFSWEGVVPVDIFLQMQELKGGLDKMLECKKQSCNGCLSCE